MKHLVSLNDLSGDDILQLLKLATELKENNTKGKKHRLLEGKSLGMIFTKSSTRTRISFEVGMFELGGHALFLSSNDIQLGRGESIHDTAKVLSRFIDGIMIRTFDHQDVIDLAQYGSIPVINGLTDREHPCQILADLLTIYEHKGTLKGLKMAYIGDGNNVAHSILHGCSKIGMDVAIATPANYQCDDEVVAEAMSAAKASGANILITNDPVEAISGADAVYTDTWISMGQEAEKAERLKIFMPYQVNQELFSYANEGACFLHCLPAYRGYEVSEDIIDGPMSVVFDQAENRLHAQKAVMVRLMGDK